MGGMIGRAMLARIKDLLGGLGEDKAAETSRSGTSELGLAAAALMVEAARMDDDFDATERDKIRALIAARFELDRDSADQLLRDAEALVADTHELYGFTRIIKDRFSYQERVEFMEMLWQVSYADGELHDYESNLMRRIAGLLYVEDRDSGEARKRAIAQMSES